MAAAKDPVCGMDVQSEKAGQKSEHRGETYYFCSDSCKREFDSHPDRYAHKGGKEASGTKASKSKPRGH